MLNNTPSAAQTALCIGSLNMNRFNKLNNLSGNIPGLWSSWYPACCWAVSPVFQRAKNDVLFTILSTRSAANDWLLVLFTIILDDQACDLLLGQIIRGLAILTPPLKSDPERNRDLGNDQKRGQRGSRKFSPWWRMRIKNDEEEGAREHMKSKGITPCDSPLRRGHYGGRVAPRRWKQNGGKSGTKSGEM